MKRSFTVARARRSAATGIGRAELRPCRCRWRRSLPPRISGSPLRNPRSRHQRFLRAPIRDFAVEAAARQHSRRAVLRSFEPWQRESDLQRVIQLFFFRVTQFADVIRQPRLFEAHQAITMDGAIVFQALLHSYVDLSRQSVPFAEDGGAYNCRVVGVNERLSTYDHERSRGLCVARRTAYSVQLPSAQESIHPRLE